MYLKIKISVFQLVVFEWHVSANLLITNASTRFATFGVVGLPLVSVIKAFKFS